MERQMLYLLDFDTVVREKDLFEHLEPFLGPIRFQLEMQIQEQELKNQRQWYSSPSNIDLSLAQSMRQSTRAASCPRIHASPTRPAGVYDSPQSYVDEDVAAGHYPRSNNNSALSLPAQTHRRRPSPYRHASRSISPPSLRDLPPLVSSGSSHSYSSSRSSSVAPSYRSRSSSLAPTSRGTPASNSGYNVDDSIVFLDNYSPSAAEYTAYANAIHAQRPSLKGHQISFQGDSLQPSKKVKSDDTRAHSVGSMMARFLNSATNNYRMARTPLQPVC